MSRCARARSYDNSQRCFPIREESFLFSPAKHWHGVTDFNFIGDNINSKTLPIFLQNFNDFFNTLMYASFGLFFCSDDFLSDKGF